MIRGFFAVLMGALALAACGEPAREWPAAKPALWEISGSDGSQGWLFGTIHALPEGVRWRTPAIDKAYADAGVVVVEIADLANSERAASTFDRMMDTRGLPPLSQRVEPADRADLAAYLDRAGMVDGDFAQLETWGAAIVLANRTRTDERTQSVDRQLIEGGKRVSGLETFAVQYGYFDTLPAKEQADLLMQLAREKPGDQRIEAWLEGDLGTLERAGGEGLLADPELREALQLGRNRKWAPQIADMVRRGEKPFVAVGAAHMFGDEGLPALLERAGYTVRRID